MVKPRPAVLPWLAETLAEKVKEELEAKHVGIYAGHKIHRIEGQNGVLKVICEDIALDADMVLVGTGVSPNSDIAARADLKLGPNNSIAVDRTLRTSDEFIYAAGDCADAYHVVSGQKTWIPLALRANRAGWAVADNVGGKQVELPGVAGTAVFRVFEMQVATTGLNVSEAAEAGFEPVANTIQSVSRAHSYGSYHPIWVSMVGDKQSGKLLGVQMVGKEGVAHRINAPAVALHAGLTVEQFSQTDLAYAPPFGPTWDPCLTAANQLLKKL
jgi:NADPH-dependent 2,4-dienoyl-CoA reductase/sulfur reductase-like enzyme